MDGHSFPCKLTVNGRRIGEHRNSAHWLIKTGASDVGILQLISDLMEIYGAPTVYARYVGYSRLTDRQTCQAGRQAGRQADRAMFRQASQWADRLYMDGKTDNFRWGCIRLVTALSRI